MDAKPSAVPSTTNVIKKEGGGGRRQQRYKRWDKHQHTPHQPSSSTLKVFEGKTEGLEDCVFDLGTANQAKIFNLNLLKLSPYAARECREPLDIKKAVKISPRPQYPSQCSGQEQQPVVHRQRC